MCQGLGPTKHDEISEIDRTANLRTEIRDFRGFASSRILIQGVEFSCPSGIVWKF